MKYLIALLLSCSTLMAVPPIGYNDPTIGGLIAWWTFNEVSGTKIYDYSGNNQIATITNFLGTPVDPIWTNGIVRNGLFVTNNTISFSSITYDPTNYSSSFWIRPQTTGPVANGYGPILRKSDGSAGIYWMPAYACLDIHDGVKFGGYRSTYDIIPLNKWTFCALSNFNLYTNGVFAFAYTNILHSFLINNMAGDINEWLNGAYDDIRIYNRALSSDEILKLYNNGYGSQK